MSQQFYNIKDYHIDKWAFLGKGCQGAIYKCFKVSQNVQIEIVCKIIKINQINQGTYEREIAIFNQLKYGEENEHIVKVYDIEIIEEEGEKMLFQFMELCETDLGKYIKACIQNEQPWPQFEELKDFAGQIIHGYSKLKSCNIIHRDLKPDNILIKIKDNKKILKITDFGLGKVLNTDCAYTNIGTPLYKAPEIQNLNYEVYTNKADIFSVGVMLYQIVYKNNPPVSLNNSQDVIKFQKSLQHTPLQCPPVEGIEQEFLNLIQNMITYSPTNRISWDQLENHQYFSGFFIKNKPTNSSHIQDYYEYVGAIYLQSQKIQIIIMKLPHDLPWESVTVNLLQFIILQFQLELELIITQLMNNQRQISSIRHLRSTTINQDKVKEFVDNNQIIININEQRQKIENLKQLIFSQLSDVQDKFFIDFFQKQLRVKSSYDEDLFDYWLLQFQIIYKEYLRSWIVGYYQKNILQLNELYQVEKFSQILIEHPKTDYINSSYQHIYSKIFPQKEMISYLEQKELL